MAKADLCPRTLGEVSEGGETFTYLGKSMSGFIGVIAGVLVIGAIIWLILRKMPFVGGKLKSYERDVKDKVVPGYDKDLDADLPGRKSRNRYSIFSRFKKKKLDT